MSGPRQGEPPPTASVRGAAAALAARANAFPASGVFAATLLWSFGPIIVLSVSTSVNTTIFWRVVVWPPVIWALARSRGVVLGRSSIRVAFVPGILFGVSTIFGFASYHQTSVANATIIGSVASALTLFAAPRFLGERVTLVQVGFAVTAFLGVAGVAFGASGAGGASLVGDLLALANAVTWTIYFVVSKRVREEGTTTWSFLFGVSVAQCVVVVPWAVVTSEDLLGMTVRDFALIGFAAVLPGTMGHGLMVWAQRFVAAGVSSLILLLSPVLSMLLAWLLFAQGVRLIQVLGGVVVLGSLAGVIRYGPQFAPPKALVD